MTDTQPKIYLPVLSQALHRFHPGLRLRTSTSEYMNTILIAIRQELEGDLKSAIDATFPYYNDFLISCANKIIDGERSLYFPDNISHDMIAAVMQTLTEEILELSGNRTEYRKRKSVTIKDVRTALRCEKELERFITIT